MSIVKTHIILAALMALAAHAQPITLVERGHSTYRIVVAAQASPSERRAARELQHFIEEMSGARLPVVTDAEPLSGHAVLVGDSAALRRVDASVPFGALGAEGFVLRTAGKHLIIAGGRERGTMYGVYTLLDKLGCRWFTQEVSRIPKRPTIQVPALSETHKPAFEYREPFFTEAWDKDWAARNRTNGDHTRLDASTGGKLKYFPFVHSFYQLLPPEKYFAAHPEYFSLIDGKRRTERGQLCLTNPEVLRIAIAQVETWIKEHPEATIFSVSQNDWEGWCECERCRRVEAEEGGEHSGPLLRFVNAVADATGARHPDKLIDTLAYWYTENPPLKARPVKNVRIRLCPIGICVAHSFAQCPRSAYFYKNLRAWSKITSQLYIWHYNTNFAHYPMPFPDFDELAADIPIYKAHGVVGLFMQGAYANGGGGENSELRAYVLARQLWDAKTDVSRTVDEFLEGVYGAAAKPMREYFDLLHAEVRPPAAQHLWIFNVPDYSDAFRRRARETLERAGRLAGDEATRARVRKDRLPVEYYELLRDAAYEVREGAWTPANPDGLAARAKDLFARMRSFGIESIHEGQPLANDEKRYEDLKSRPALRLENAAWRVYVVPSMSARVVGMLEKATGREALRQMLTGAGGIQVSAYDDYHAKPWNVKWSVGEQTATRLTLTGRSENGVRFERTLELTDNGLRAVTVATNGGSAPVLLALEARSELSPGDIDKASMAFSRVSGARVDRKFIVEGEPPTNKETWSGSERPAREWRLVRAGDTLTVRFSDAEVGRAALTWAAKSRPGVTLSVWSPERTLKAGESLRLETVYRGDRN